MFNVLYVEDEPDEDLVEFLDEAGYEVRKANDGSSALAIVESERPDIILLDIMMPPGDKLVDEEGIEEGYRTGVVFLRHLKRVAKDIPVVVLSAIPSPEVEQTVKREGVYKYMHKSASTSLTEIIATLREALEKSRGAE